MEVLSHTPARARDSTALLQWQFPEKPLPPHASYLSAGGTEPRLMGFFRFRSRLGHVAAGGSCCST